MEAVAAALARAISLAVAALAAVAVLTADFLSFLLDCLAPRVCVACGGELGIPAPDPETPFSARRPAATAAFLEADFRMALPGGISVAANPLCRACWLALEPSPGAGTLPSPREGGQPIRVISPFFTNDELLALVRFLKFDGGRTAVPPLAWWMAQSLRTHDAWPAGDSAPREALLIPVPLHRSRERERGYNQAALLANEVAAILGLECSRAALERSRKTKSQSTIESPQERSVNVRGAFRAVLPAAIRGRRIVLVDDLVTTGETIRSCAEAVLDCGPLSLTVLSAGRVRDAPE